MRFIPCQHKAYDKRKLLDLGNYWKYIGLKFLH